MYRGSAIVRVLRLLGLLVYGENIVFDFAGVSIRPPVCAKGRKDIFWLGLTWGLLNSGPVAWARGRMSSKPLQKQAGDHRIDKLYERTLLCVGTHALKGDELQAI